MKIVISWAILVSLSLQCVKNGMAFPQDHTDPHLYELKSLVQVLGSDATSSTKRDASAKLVAAGKTAIPVLMGALRDSRVYEQRDIANRMNLPANAPPPKPVIAKITVGQRCEDLLYQIITPAYSSPFAGNFKVYSEQMLQVDDWASWWASSRQKSLTEIHRELRPLVDEYWKKHGTTQKVRVNR